MNINLDKILRAMAIALDLAELSSIEDIPIIEKISNVSFEGHAFLHHSRRTTYISLEIAKAMELSTESYKDIYIAALLHDIGAVNTLKKSHNSDAFIRNHCTYGSSILESFNLFKTVSNIIFYHHENWNGSGAMQISGSDIPVESQIIRVSDLIELLYQESIPWYSQKDRIIKWVNLKKDIIFSEEIVNAFLKVSSKDIFWLNVESIPYMDFILESIAPKLDKSLNLEEFENIAYIFSQIIDNKSKFTAMHSREIAKLCYRVAKHVGYDEEKALKMKIAGLLHDIGKLAIPTTILDKEGSLSTEEFSTIKAHAYYTKLILDQIEGLDEISVWASTHHEKLDGSGYPQALQASEISEESKIIGVCDIFQALTEDRPYRKGLSFERAFTILNGMASDGLICSQAVLLLKDALSK